MRHSPHFSLPERAPVARWVERWGGASSTALFDPRCELFRLPGVDGAIGFRRGLAGRAVAFGDPVCARYDRLMLVHGFRARFRVTAFLGASDEVRRLLAQLGYAAAEVGQSRVFDPQHDALRGPGGYELKKRLLRARRAGVTVDSTRREGRRWFTAWVGGRRVGVLSLVRLRRAGGFLVEQVLPAADAPGGTAETLVCAALAGLAHEGATRLAFRPLPLARPLCSFGFGPLSAALLRRAWPLGMRRFRRKTRARARRKQGHSTLEPSYLLLAPPRLGPLELHAILRACDVWLS